MVERRVLGRERHPQLEFRAFDLAFADDALNLPLRSDADDLEEFSQSDIEAILVRCDPLKTSTGQVWSRTIADAGKGEQGHRNARAAWQSRHLAALGIGALSLSEGRCEEMLPLSVLE